MFHFIKNEKKRKKKQIQDEFESKPDSKLSRELEQALVTNDAMQGQMDGWKKPLIELRLRN